ncbi:MAG TPA: YlxR family protein [Methylomirabilota bacterium]|nr:YlxR family protein [Methylomirabilota bacterium]
MKNAAPQRTCIGCRAIRPKAALLRLVRGEDGRVTVDRNGGASGRSAYACPTPECLIKALQAGRLAHAFRRATAPPGESPADLLASWKGR